MRFKKPPILSRHVEAEELCVESLRCRRQLHDEERRFTLEATRYLSSLCRELKQFDEAEPLLIQAIKGRHLKLGDTHPHTIESLDNLIDLYEAWNKPDKTEEW
ncbi:tetratricopeptide repeat protein [Planctomycetota bacterium]